MSSKQEERTFIHRAHAPYWDWFSESPIELILLGFILIIFFFLPRQGCGVSLLDPSMDNEAAIQQSE